MKDESSVLHRVALVAETGKYTVSFSHTSDFIKVAHEPLHKHNTSIHTTNKPITTQFPDSVLFSIHCTTQLSALVHADFMDHF